MNAMAGRSAPALPAAHPGDERQEQLLGIGAAAERAGVSQRALRYYQQIGLLTPCGCTPGGLRRYSEEDLARVARIRQLQELLGLDLDAIARVLNHEDRMAQIKRAYLNERTSGAERQELLREGLDLQQRLRAIVEAKLGGIEGFLADLDARISRTRALLDQAPEPVSAGPPGARSRKS
jgi:MerR family transcriptional regulator, repressor of the yfmOP operon